MAGERERGGGHRGGREERDSEFVDKLVHINRVAKVVKGGKRFGFAALVVIGDQKGRVGFGHGKAREVPEAIRKATELAKRNLTRVALREGRTLHHDIAGRHGAGRVYLRAAPAGTGIIAGGPMRAVFETLGIQDVVAKSIGSSNPYNMVRADLRRAEASGFAAFGCGAPQHQGVHAAVPPCRRRRRSGRRITLRADSAFRSYDDGQGRKDDQGRADRQRDPPPSLAACDADRPQAQQDRPGHRTAGYP